MIVKVGYGKSSLTPLIGTALAGFASSDRWATGVHDDLYARAIILEIEQMRYAIVQNDLLALDKESIHILQKPLKDFGFEEQNIFIGATHTHSGPKGTMKGTMFGESMESVIGRFNPSVFSQIEAAVSSAVTEAFHNIEKCYIRYGLTEVTDVATNRNYPDDHGDPALLVMEFNRIDGKKVLLYNFACHPTILNINNTMITADLPWGVSTILENSSYDMVMFINGNSGDISTRFTRKYSDFNEVKRLSTKLLCGINSALLKLKLLNTANHHVTSFDVAMKIKAMDSIAIAEDKVHQYKIKLKEAQMKNLPDLRLYESRLEGALINLELSKSFENISNVSLNISILRLGSLIFVFIPGELFSSLCNPLRAEFEGRIIFCGYFNGYFGYIADKRAYDTGNYEALSSPFCSGQGEVLIDSIRNNICKGEGF
ncbi:MAG: neutral/alkaline non-lysosomal ceramidase N-terminal domain-containing protein [Oscillospiraceae bacterium]|nr:neutral/alkaline non-lysosomal ceramidase N-terminal domain-containing protein [Oscillospiraceae bacterium]